MLTFIDKEKNYKLYDKNNRVVETIKGEKLYSDHYDRVEANVRKRYENIQKEQHVMVPKPKQRKR